MARIEDEFRAIDRARYRLEGALAVIVSALIWALIISLLALIQVS